MKKIIIISLIGILLIFKIIILLFFTFNNFSSEENEINLIDVNQGTSVLIKLNKKIILIDSGYDTNKFQKYILEYFNKNKYLNNRIDYFFTSHNHIDHINNSLWIAKTFNVNKFYLPRIYTSIINDIDNISSYRINDLSNEYLNYFNFIINNNLNWEFIDESDINDIEGIKILDINNLWNNSNNFSPFFLIKNKNTNIVISLDAEIEKEIAIVNKYNNLFKSSDLYIMGHHGSYTSSNIELINYIKPTISIYSSNNYISNYGHPNINSLNRVAKYSKKIFGTDLNGNLEFIFNTKIFARKKYTITTRGYIDKFGNKEKINYIQYDL